MKTIVLVLCLLVPMSAWAQKEGGAVEPQLKMIKKANEAVNEGKGLASGVPKSQKAQPPDQPNPAAPAGTDAGEKPAGAVPQPAD